jgi:proteasome lid subunit RPN8/RPN11
MMLTGEELFAPHRHSCVEPSLLQVLIHALAYGEEHGEEESGGLILYREKDKRYLWLPLANKHAGTTTARALFEPTEEGYKEMASKFQYGWRLNSSFHTHPMFPSNPSKTDLTLLFTNFNRNFIYSIRDNYLAIYTWTDETHYKKSLIKL